MRSLACARWPSFIFVAALLAQGCGGERDLAQAERVQSPPSAKGDWGAERGDQDFELFFTEPGYEKGAEVDTGIEWALVDAIEGARQSVDVAAYELDSAPLVDAMIRAHRRGVAVRFFGENDRDHDEGYEALAKEGVPSWIRSNSSIMHHKFVLIDESEIWTGSANFSYKGFYLNNNHFVRMRSPDLAAAYALELDEFAAGRFGTKKSDSAGGTYSVGGEEVSLWFAPQDRPEERLLELMRGAKTRVYFMIFAFTSGSVARELKRLDRQGVEVFGVYDSLQRKSFYSSSHALIEAGLSVRVDGNKNVVGGSQGGKLHHKVMLIDPGEGEEAIAVLGSTNWTRSGFRRNDENMLVVRGRERVDPFVEEFCEIWIHASDFRDHPIERHPSLCQDPGPEPKPEPDPERPDDLGDETKLVINEVMADPFGPGADREWIEIVNASDEPIWLEGIAIEDGWRERHVFGRRSIAPWSTIIVAGSEEGGPRGSIEASSGLLGLNDSGDTVTLFSADRVELDSVSFGRSSEGVSWTREIEADRNAALVDHRSIAGLDASPGAMADGVPW